MIIGQRPISWPTDNIPPGSIAFQDGYYGMWKFNPDGSPNPEYNVGLYSNEHIIKFDVSAANTPQAVLLALKLASSIATIGHGLSYLSETQNINTAGGVLRGEDFKLNWDWVNIKIVDNMPDGSHGSPMVTSWSPDGTGNYAPNIYVNINALDHYGQADGSGLNYALMHEIAHITTPGQQTANQMIMEYMNATGDTALAHWGEYVPAENPWHAHLEYVANNIAITVADMLQIPVIHDPVNGWMFP
ncbi:hypothetical protein [Caulobacter segnis]|uniref:hypothetical protein n=1 Tax=Caulobacter segnis TaxID=88688 RepID=UPI0012EDA5AD|nr:hypothetical protein [Caulobacter segnis]